MNSYKIVGTWKNFAGISVSSGKGILAEYGREYASFSVSGVGDVVVMSITTRRPVDRRGLDYLNSFGLLALGVGV